MYKQKVGGSRRHDKRKMNRLEQCDLEISKIKECHSSGVHMLALRRRALSSTWREQLLPRLEEVATLCLCLPMNGPALAICPDCTWASTQSTKRISLQLREGQKACKEARHSLFTADIGTNDPPTLRYPVERLVLMPTVR